MRDPVDRLDGLVGDLIERIVRAHHKRRLRPLGWEQALSACGPAFIAKTAAPNEGNHIDVLIDGAEVLPAIADAIRQARTHVHVAGWHMRNQFSMLGPEAPTLSVHDLLADAARRAEVRVLLWAGSPAPVFHPTRAEVDRERRELTSGTGIQCALDDRERPLHCHHEKLLIVDDEIAFVGGVDLTDLGGDRFDDSNHPPREGIGWHDSAVRVRGPLVRDVGQHFAMRWQAVTGESLTPAPTPAAIAGGVSAQLVRTVPEGLYPAVENGDFSILAYYIGSLRGAQLFIYLESQFLWSPEVVAVLADKLTHPPHDDFRIVVMLPSRPFSGAGDTRGQLAVLEEADAGNNRFLACSVSALKDSRSKPVYVHAKIGIVDDEWLTVGSANLNDHSLFNDTEVNVVVKDTELATTTRQRLWAEHLRTSINEVRGEPVRIVDDVMRPIAEEQLALARSGAPRTHPLVKLAPESRRAERLLGPLQGIVVDG